MAENKTVVLLSEEAVFATGLKTILAPAGMEVMQVADCGSLLEYVQAIKPDLFVVDFVNEEQFSAIWHVRALMADCKVAVFAREIQVEVAYQMMKLGIQGILPKTLSADALITALRKMLGGEIWCDPKLAASLLKTKAVPLSVRESQLVTLVSQGLKNKEIATALSISEATIRVYLSALFRKLGLKDRYELAIFGMKNMANRASGFGDASHHWERLRYLLIDNRNGLRKAMESDEPAQALSMRAAV